jgi:FlaA1/EpsC-like NDP-sugar epimerase
VDGNEKIIATLGTQATLGDKRLYIKASGEKTLDMQDYKHAMVRHTKPYWLFFTALAVTVYSTVTAVQAFNAWVRFSSTPAQWTAFFVTALAAFILFFIYTRLRRSWIEITFEAGTTVLNITKIDPLAVQHFQRSMRIIKDGRLRDL